jgi:hypothetical protein
MNTESKAILALITLLVAGFLAFVFFSNGTDQDPNKPDGAPTTLIKTPEPKPDTNKPVAIIPPKIPTEEAKPIAVTPRQTSPGLSKPAEVKPVEPKPDTTKPAEPKPAVSTTKEIKPDEVKPVEPKPAAVKPTIANSSLEDLIQVTNPLPNDEIISPVVIEGKARGSWFFEASFPVMLADSSGKIIARGTAAAKSGWMTEDFVPFSAKLDFTPDYGNSGTVIIHNDNPSNLPQNTRELKIPVVFAQAGDMTVQAFFCNSSLDPDFKGEKTFAIRRVVPKRQAVAKAALEELLKGPTEEEKASGYFTCINPDVKIQKLLINSGVARVDFDKQIEFQVGGSARVSAIRSQITQTLRQFPTVEKVIISVDGRTQDILQP